MHDLLNAEEAADYLRLSTQYLAKLRCAGGGPAFCKVGRRVLYRKDDLLAWLSTCARKSTSDCTSNA